MNKPFRKKFDQPRLTPVEAARQGRASRLAFEALGSAGAIAFLNTHDDALGGRPIDLAVVSAEGAAVVEDAITARIAAGKPAV